MRRTPLGQLLVESGSIDGRQLRAGLDWQKRRGGRLGNALVHLGMAREGDVMRALGSQLGIPTVDLIGRDVPSEVVGLVPARIVAARQVLPLQLLSESRRGPLVVATADPLDLLAMDEVAFASGKQLRVALATRSQLEVSIAHHLGRRHPEALELGPEPTTEMDLVRPLSERRFVN